MPDFLKPLLAHTPTQKCCALTYPLGIWSSVVCGKPAKTECDGKHYCGTHDPVRRAARREAKTEVWRAAWAANSAAAEIQKAEEAATAHKAACFADLLAALEAVVATDDLLRVVGSCNYEQHIAPAFDKARAAIAAAKGQP